MKDALGHGSNAHSDGVQQIGRPFLNDPAVPSNEQRFHVSFRYTNPEKGKGWENTGNQVVHHENMEGAAAQIMRERNIPQITVIKRHHANGQVDEVNRQFKNPAYRAPAPVIAKRKRK